MATSEQWLERLPKRMRELVREARRSGWTVEATNKSHVRFTAPDGRTVIGSGAGRQLDQHMDRTEGRLRRLGLEREDRQ